MKETREQYLARKKAQAEKHAAWIKRRNERAAERQRIATEEAKAAYDARRHITTADLRRESTHNLELLLENLTGVDRSACLKELERRARKHKDK